AISPNAKPKSAPPRSRTPWMWSSEVMLRINSSVSSDVSGGPSTRCRMPCTRIVGGVPTRTWRSDAPSDTTNCNRSAIEYDMLGQINQAFSLDKKIDTGEAQMSRLLHVSDRCPDDLIRGRQAREHFADPVFPQGPHPHFPGAGAQHGGGNFFVDQLPSVV